MSFIVLMMSCTDVDCAEESPKTVPVVFTVGGAAPVLLLNIELNELNNPTAIPPAIAAPPVMKFPVIIEFMPIFINPELTLEIIFFIMPLNASLNDFPCVNTSLNIELNEPAILRVDKPKSSKNFTFWTSSRTFSRLAISSSLNSLEPSAALRCFKS